ncbi:unnamed protein product [Alopecurus aequalis]
MSQKRPLDTVAPEQEEAPPSPTKRLRRIRRRERRRARRVSLDQMTQMVRQAQFDMAKLFVLLDLPNVLAEQFAALQRSFMGSIEEKIRSVLHTEMQERQLASVPNDVHEPLRQIVQGIPGTGGISRDVKLRFVDAERPKDPLYTGCPVDWQNGQQAKVAIFENERQIMQGNLSKLQIEILPVHADFFTERGQEDFTKEELDRHIHMYKGKESVLITATLRNGEAYLGPFFFTESSYRKKLRLAARVKRQDLAVRVQEAITSPFVVKDRRSESNKKSYPPSKEEAVHCLEKISLKGKRYNDLAGKNIITVKLLMRHYHRDKSGLQKLTGMKKEDWSTMIKHATTTDPGNDIYSYKAEEENCELLFNDFYDLVGMMINGLYVPCSFNDINRFPQIKVNNWKMSAHKKFEELDNSVGLIPDYLMRNGLPVRAVRLNSDASTSIQARTAWQFSNDITAQQEFGEQEQFLQENGFSPVWVFSNKDAGPSRLEKLPLQQYTYEQTMHQELRRQDPSLPCNEIPHNLTHGNMAASFSIPSTIPSHNFAPAQDDSLVTGFGLTAQHNGYLRSSTTDAPDTSYPVIGGVSVRISSLSHVQTKTLPGLPSTEEWQVQEHVAGQGFVPPSDELTSYSIFDDCEL